MNKLERGEELYAERVTKLYRKIEERYGSEAADLINEFVRGASMLENGRDFVAFVDGLSEKVLTMHIDKLREQLSILREAYGETGIYDIFVRAGQEGRCKVMVWNGLDYHEAVVGGEESKLLPWGGFVYCGGPLNGPSGTMILLDTKMKTGAGTLVINGVKIV